jgi:hypothetical protein
MKSLILGLKIRKNPKVQGTYAQPIGDKKHRQGKPLADELFMFPKVDLFGLFIQANIAVVSGRLDLTGSYCGSYKTRSYSKFCC